MYRDAEVFVNGWLVGHHEGGYNSFRLRHHGRPELWAAPMSMSSPCVWTRLSLRAGSYEGAGIYRCMFVVRENRPVAIAPDGVFVWSEFKNNVPGIHPQIHVQVQLLNWQTNAAKTVVRADNLFLRMANRLPRSMKRPKFPANPNTDVTMTTHVWAPELWSPENAQPFTNW